ncbi:MAG: dephospho-CoA kinase [Burkholderiaceae bacterium]
MRYTVGLTGGIGSGKSTVAERFADKGIAIVDADVAAHRLTASGGLAIDAIREAFGPSFIAVDGSLDRVRMRAHVFADANERRKLEAILHPMIRAACEAERASAGSPYVLLVVPLLFESTHGASQSASTRAISVQRTLVVACDPRVQVERVMRRTGMSETEVMAIIATQMPAAQRIALADDVIDNSGPEDALDRPIERLHRLYLEAATRHA